MSGFGHGSKYLKKLHNVVKVRKSQYCNYYSEPIPATHIGNVLYSSSDLSLSIRSTNTAKK